MDKSLIRNFSIIAHIDHGKSTLADRILELTGAVDMKHKGSQLLDDMDLERERGITIKASMVRLAYKSRDGKEYVLNLIDTPGHVDFTYEVSKSLAACEGAVLVVDAGQGIEAQTVANYYLAMENDLEIIPVLNKIDLVSIDIPKAKKQIISVLGFKEEDIILASAKDGTGVKEILERIIQVIPEPKGAESKPLKALVFDCRFDAYKGVVVFVRVVDGLISPSTQMKMIHSGEVYKIEELGVFKNLKYSAVESLTCGEVGYFTANIREPRDIIIGDTITDVKNPCADVFPGYRQPKPLVFCGIYPVNPGDFTGLRDAMDKLKLSDASFVFEPENSQSFGSGFRCGFLGLLHMEIVQERLEREYNLNLILTVPNVVYRVIRSDGEMLEVDTPVKLPPSQDIREARLKRRDQPGGIVNGQRGLSDVGNVTGALDLKLRNIPRRLHQVNPAPPFVHFVLAHGSFHLGVAGVPDEHALPAVPAVTRHLHVHLGDQGTGRIEDPQPPSLGLSLHHLGYAVGTEDYRSPVRHRIEFVDKYGTLLAQALHDKAVMHYFVTHVNGCPKDLQGALDDLNGAIHTGAEAARVSQNDFH